MKDAVLAALRGDLKRLLVIDPSVQLASLLARRGETTQLTILHQSAKVARRSIRQLNALSPPSAAAVSVMLVRFSSLPFEAASHDAVVLERGFVGGGLEIDPVEELRLLRRMVRPGGVVMVGSRLREGALGGMGSLVKRVGQQGALPRAADLTGWMLIAGMRRVRQATLPRALVPTALTWAEVTHRPWESEGS